MNTREMQIRFERIVQSTDPTLATTDKMTSDNILYFLNMSQDRYLKETYLSKATMIDNIEFINKRSDALKPLIVRYKDQALDASYTLDTPDGGIIIDVPSDYLFYMSSLSKLKRTDLYVESEYDYVPNRLILHGELLNVVTTPINKPILRQPAALLEGDNKIILYKDGYTDINNFYLIYLRNPKTLVLGTPSSDETNTCELAEHTHQEIVELAAKLFIEDHRFKLRRAE